MGVSRISRKQWGHGYWKGVEDATNKVSDLLPQDEMWEGVCFWVANMCMTNSNRYRDQGLYPVKDLILDFSIDGRGEKAAKKLYDYVLKRTPLGCYVSGGLHSDWKDDYFVLPKLSEETALGICDEIAKRQEERSGLTEQRQKERELISSIKNI